MEKKLTLDLDHINGINNDHRLENLRFLCPNCHSQTETYAGKNFSDHQKFTEEQIVEIREVLEAGESVSSLCRKYNVKYNTISSIRDNKIYKYI